MSKSKHQAKKIALIFPGIGYHCDKPLLYYGKKLASKYGYKIIEIPYTGFKKGIKGNPQLMLEAFQLALSQTKTILKHEDLDSKDDILIISKSIGTAVAAAYQQENDIVARNLYFTPVDDTFRFVRPESGIVFHGTGDSWAHTDEVIRQCNELNLPLYLTEDANHSMEVGEPIKDIRTMEDIMEKCEKYLSNRKEAEYVFSRKEK